jgi:hypothetical protein
MTPEQRLAVSVRAYALLARGEAYRTAVDARLQKIEGRIASAQARLQALKDRERELEVKLSNLRSSSS